MNENLAPLLRKSVALAKNGQKSNGSVLSTRYRSVAVNKAGEPILPKTLAECADLLYKTRETRLAAQRELELFDVLESALKKKLIEELPKTNSTGISGKFATAQLDKKHIPQVADWDKFYKYVKKNDAFFLLQKRLAESAIKEMLENKERVPGVTVFHADVISCTVRKGGGK